MNGIFLDRYSDWSYRPQIIYVPHVLCFNQQMLDNVSQDLIIIVEIKKYIIDNVKLIFIDGSGTL